MLLKFLNDPRNAVQSQVLQNILALSTEHLMKLSTYAFWIIFQKIHYSKDDSIIACTIPIIQLACQNPVFLKRSLEYRQNLSEDLISLDILMDELLSLSLSGSVTGVRASTVFMLIHSNASLTFYTKSWDHVLSHHIQDLLSKLYESVHKFCLPAQTSREVSFYFRGALCKLGI
jgi:hypothetical protein